MSLAQDHDMDHGDDHDMDHGDDNDGGGGDPGDGPPYGPPEPGRNPGEQRETIRYGPYNIPAPGPLDGHHGHTGNVIVPGVENPCDNCQITSMTAKLVNAAGEEIGNPQGLQLHHMVLFQRELGRDDATCGGLSFPIPFGLLFGERFFASGDERTPVVAPPGFGYPVGTGGWTMIYELANSNETAQNAYIEMVYDYVPGNTMKNVDPVWFDIDQCGLSATNVPAGNQTRTWTWNVNRPGDLIAVGGHQHGNLVDGEIDGGVNMELRLGDANGEVICDSRAGYDESPFYTDNHGMKWLSSMTQCGSIEEAESLVSLNTGQQMTITSHYEQREAWPGQMGIMIAYVAPDGVGGGSGGSDDECSWWAALFGWC